MTSSVQSINNIEIERKFLVRDDSYKALATSSIHIRQGYLSRTPNCTIRVRVTSASEKPLPLSSVSPLQRGNQASTAFLTIKSKPAPNGFAHYEFEKPITVDEANELLKLALPGMIDKRRWLIPIHSLPFREESEVGSQLLCEVDEFFGDNAGLVMAEVELPTEDTPFVHPAFLGDEVTFDKRYYNSYLSQHPFSTW